MVDHQPTGASFVTLTDDASTPLFYVIKTILLVFFIFFTSMFFSPFLDFFVIA